MPGGRGFKEHIAVSAYNLEQPWLFLSASPTFSRGSDAASSQSPPNGADKPEFLSVDVDQAVREAQLLAAYASEAGIEVNAAVLRKIVDSK